MAAIGSGDPLLLKAALVAGPRIVAESLWSIATAEKRSFTADSKRAVAKLTPRPIVDGVAHVPPAGPFLLVGNHYQARGLWIGWATTVITSAIAAATRNDTRELHWMIMADWRSSIFGRQIVNPLTTIIFPRASVVWGLIPVSMDPSDIGGRAIAVRRTLRYLGDRRDGYAGPFEPVAMFPEGEASVALREARRGSGAFFNRVNSMGVPIVPVGIYEQEGVLTIRFGAPISLTPPPGLATSVDIWARTEVMVSIGRLLPSDLWGFYAAEIAKREG